MEQSPSDIPTSPSTDDGALGIEHLQATLTFPPIADLYVAGYPVQGAIPPVLAQPPWPTIPWRAQVPDAGFGNAFYNIEAVLGDIINGVDIFAEGEPLGLLEQTLASTLRQGAPHKHVVSSDGEQQIELGIVKEEDGEVVCCFSQAPLEVGDETGKLPCEHIFAREDLLKWLRTEQALCPICRFALDSKEVPQSAESVTASSMEPDAFGALLDAAPMDTDDDMPELIPGDEGDESDEGMPGLIQVPFTGAPAADVVLPPPPVEGVGGAQTQHLRVPMNPQALVTMLMQAEFERAASREEELALQAALWETYAISGQ